MKDFVNRIYSKLNPVIINWVDYYASLDQIDEYESNRYKYIKGFNSPVNTYKVGIELVNGYVKSNNINDKEGEERKEYIRNKVVLGIANNIVYLVLFLVYRWFVG
jgi:hypothetical protein